MNTVVSFLLLNDHDHNKEEMAMNIPDAHRPYFEPCFICGRHGRMIYPAIGLESPEIYSRQDAFYLVRYDVLQDLVKEDCVPALKKTIRGTSMPETTSLLSMALVTQACEYMIQGYAGVHQLLSRCEKEEDDKTARSACEIHLTLH